MILKIVIYLLRISLICKANRLFIITLLFQFYYEIKLYIKQLIGFNLHSVHIDAN